MELQLERAEETQVLVVFLLLVLVIAVDLMDSLLTTILQTLGMHLLHNMNLLHPLSTPLKINSTWSLL